MPIYIKCKLCKSTQDYRAKVCKNCGNPLPQREKIYRVVVNYGGQTVTKEVSNSLELAKKVESKIKTELIEDSYYDRRKKAHTLDEIWGRYLNDYKAVGKGWKRDESRYNGLIKPRFGSKPLDNISPLDIQRLINDMRKTNTKRGKPYTPKSVKNTVELVGRLFNYAKRMDMYDGDNPCKKVNLPKVSNMVTNVLDEGGITNLLKVLDEWPDIQVTNIIRLALFTGLREGELFRLKWESVDLEGGWLFIKDPKGGKDQVIPLNEMALSVLREHPRMKDSDFVFPNKKGGPRCDIKGPWAKIKELSGIPKTFRFHDLRHTYASWLASSGKVDIYTLQRLLTHKSPQMTQRYAHLVEESLKRGSRVLDELFKNVTSNNVVRLMKEDT